MEDYLINWWNGTLSNYYFWGLTIAQLNKILKVLQYITGFLTIFELIRFADIMGKFKILSLFSVSTLYLIDKLSNLPNFILRFLLIIIIIPINIIKKINQQKEISLKNDFCIPVWVTFKGFFTELKDEAKEDAKSHFLVRIFNWFEKHPIPERSIKTIIFISFAIFSLGEIFTS